MLDRTGKLLLGVIAVCLAAIAFRPYGAPPAARAQENTRRFYIEPGALMLRKPGGDLRVYGKMVVDLETGHIWGFPTGMNSPYPVDPTSDVPPVSKPIYLGQFDFSTARK